MNKPFLNMNIENLMPSNNHNYNKTKKLNVFTISSGKQINVDPSRDFNSNDLFTIASTNFYKKIHIMKDNINLLDIKL